jgi:SAM-dependent methyltransferase
MAARCDSPKRGRLLTGGLTYFEYQRVVCRDVVIPWLERRISLDGLVVADLGAHHGGMLEELRAHGKVAGAVGLELSKEVVASSPFVGDERFRLEVADVLEQRADAGTYDLVLLHDVLEHIPEYEPALQAIAGLLRPGGHVFISFPPYYSAFGGHQQYAKGRARFTPFAHFLPARLFYRFAEPGEQEYMTPEGAREDLVAVRQTRLTLAGAEQGFARAGLDVVSRELYLVRPEYTVRYDLRPRGAGVLGRVPAIRELAVNGAFYLLRRRS